MRASSATQALGRSFLRQSDGVAAASLPVGVRTIVIDEALQDGPAPDGLPAAPVPPHEASFIVYTSGSTGHPKGIVLSQRAVLHRARQLVDAVHLRPDDKVLSLASPSTIGGLQQIFEVMLSGATLVKLDLLRTGLGTVLQAIAQRRLTMMFSRRPSGAALRASPMRPLPWRPCDASRPRGMRCWRSTSNAFGECSPRTATCSPSMVPRRRRRCCSGS